MGAWVISCLSIVDCNREDTGRYQLEASNSCGSAKLGFGVNVVSKYFMLFDAHGDHSFKVNNS